MGPARHFKVLTTDLIRVVPLTASISVHPQMVILGRDRRARTFAPKCLTREREREILCIERGHSDSATAR